MILVDTSIWIDHLRKGDDRLVALLNEGSVLIHHLVIEELACGNLSRRDETLELMEALPQAPQVRHAEFLDFVTRHRLDGMGLGAVDVHLLAATCLAHARLWTRDRKLRRAGDRLEVLATSA